MTITVGKVAPTLIVTAVVGYCCWSHLDGSAAQPSTKGKSPVPELSAALLKPAPPPDPPRNPFALGEGAKAANLPRPKAAATQVVPPVIAPADREETAKLLSGLSLKATWVRGERAMALINGRFYGSGDTLEVAGIASDGNNAKPGEAAEKKPSTREASSSSAGKSTSAELRSVEPFVVSRVLRDRVLLARHGETIELTYTDRGEARPASVPPKPANSRPGAKSAR